MFENDDDDFVLSPNSKLSSIFTTSASNQSNSNLTYKAPKQPRPVENSNESKSISSEDSKSEPQTPSAVLLAKVITLWKLENNKNKSLGKYMVAIIKNNPTGLHDMIIYQKKEFILIRVVLGKSQTFHKYPNNFVAFTDYSNQLWNLSFNTTLDMEAFIEFATKQDCVIVDQSQENSARNDSTVTSEPTTEMPATKEQILSKVTKLGLPILPRTIDRTKSSELSDSESSSSDLSPVKPTVAPRKARRHIAENKSLAPILPESSAALSHLNNNVLMANPNNQLALNHPHAIGLMYAQPLPDMGLSNFIVAQNAELKANLAEINMKLNTALQSRDSNGNVKEQTDSSGLQTKIKCQNLKIDNLSTELERSKKALLTLNGKYEEKCQELSRVISERVNMEEFEMAKATADALKTDLKEKSETIQTQNDQIVLLKETQTSSQLLVDNLQRENRELKLRLEEQDSKLDELQEQLKDQHKLSSDAPIDKEKINKVVKESMNEAFGGIMERFNEGGSYSFDDIQTVLLENLKKTSYRLINSLS